MKQLSLIVKSLCLALLLTMPQALQAGGTGNTVDSEISFLLECIKTSGCSFQRNGKSFTPIDAAEHINKKYLYFLKKGKIKTAEDFIRYAASKSSISGKAYTVQCGDSAPVESWEWLTAALKQLRAE
jgi:hypothetical protein